MLRITSIGNFHSTSAVSMSAMIKKLIGTNKESRKITRDIWDFGDSLVIGIREDNDVVSWEAVRRFCVCTTEGEHIYADIFVTI